MNPAMLFRGDVSHHWPSYRGLRSFRRFNFGLLWRLILYSNRPVEKRKGDDQKSDSSGPAILLCFPTSSFLPSGVTLVKFGGPAWT